MSLNLTVHQGGRYLIRVRTNHANALWSNIVNLTTNEILPVENVDVIQQKNGSLYIHWKEPKWPKELKDHKMTFGVYIKDTTDSARSENLTASQSHLTYHHVRENAVYTIQVEVLEQHGYKSRLSEVYNFTTGGLFYRFSEPYFENLSISIFSI